MQDQRELLAAVCAEPEDDAPRLVYADWLEENGLTPGQRARAEFIRVQVTLAGLPPEAPERAALARRESELEWFRREWDRQLPELTGVLWLSYTRGFIDRIKAPLGALRKHAGRLFAAAPFRHLWATGNLTLESAAALADTPGLARITFLDLRQVRLSPGAFARLAGSPHWRSVRHLDLSHTGFGPDDAAALASSPLVRELETLNLDVCRAGSDGARALAEASWPRLQSLALSHSSVGPDGAEALATSTGLPALQRLGLSSNPIGDGVLPLASPAPLPALRELSVGNCGLRPETIADLRGRFGPGLWA